MALIYKQSFVDILLRKHRTSVRKQPWLLAKHIIVLESPDEILNVFSHKLIPSEHQYLVDVLYTAHEMKTTTWWIHYTFKVLHIQLYMLNTPQLFKCMLKTSRSNITVLLATMNTCSRIHYSTLIYYNVKAYKMMLYVARSTDYYAKLF